MLTQGQSAASGSNRILERLRAASVGPLHGARVLGRAVRMLPWHVRRLQEAIRRKPSMDKWIVHVARNDLVPIGPDRQRVGATCDVPEKHCRSARLAHDDAESSFSVPHVLTSPPRWPPQMRCEPLGRVSVAQDLRRVRRRILTSRETRSTYHHELLNWRVKRRNRVLKPRCSVSTEIRIASTVHTWCSTSTHSQL